MNEIAKHAQTQGYAGAQVHPASQTGSEAGDRALLLWLSTTDFGVSDTSTRYQRLSSLCANFAVDAIVRRPLDDRYQLANNAAVADGLRAFFAAARRAQKHDADIVSVSSEPLGLIAGYVAKAGRPLVIQVWDDPAKMARIRADSTTGWRHRAALLRLEAMVRFTRWLFAQADLIVLSLDPARVGSLYSIPPERMLAVPNGAVIAPFQLPSPTRYEDLHDPPRVVYTGPLQSARIATLLAAAAELHRRDVDIEIRLLGPVVAAHDDPAVRDRLEQAPPNVIVEPGLHSGERLREAVADADVCVIPYLDTFEIDCTYPIKLFEYFTAAKPVVSTSLWGVRQVASDGHDVVLVAPGDSTELAKAIERVLADPALRERLGHNARATATRYAWTDINETVCEAMDRLIATTGSRS